jgi:hypothetical protein
LLTLWNNPAHLEQNSQPGWAVAARAVPAVAVDAMPTVATPGPASSPPFSSVRLCGPPFSSGVTSVIA